MPRIIKQSDITLGHGGCWAPTPVLTSISQGVLVEGQIPITSEDQYAPHGCPPAQMIHVGELRKGIGSPNVFIGDIPVLRDGDPIRCGDIINSLGSNVFINGGGLGGPGTQLDPGQTIGYSITRPVIIYPSTNLRYKALQQITDPPVFVFIDSCPVEIRPTVYTPLIEEGTQAEYRNFPGSPWSSQVGADLPPYAPTSYRTPIDVFGLEVYAQIDQEQEFRVLNGVIYDGITIDYSTGLISGRLNPRNYEFERVIRVRVGIRNLTNSEGNVVFNTFTLVPTNIGPNGRC